MTTPKTPQICKFTAYDTQLAQESIRLDHEIKKLSARKKTIDADLTAKMEANGALLATYRASTIAERVHWQRHGLDVAQIKLMEPEIAKRFPKDTDGYRIQYLLAI